MKQIKIYDPALCCPTGLCGVNIDPELMRIAVLVETFKRKGIIIERYNLRDHPQVYIDAKKVNEYLMKEGVECLPIVTLDGDVAITKGYPTDKQVAEWLNISDENIEYISNSEK